MFLCDCICFLCLKVKKHVKFPLQSVRLTCAKWQQMEDVCSGRVMIEPGLWCDSVSDYSPPWCWEQMGLSPGNTLLLLRLWLHPSHQNHELGFWKDLFMGILEMVNPDLWAMDSLNFRLRGFISDSNTTWIDSPPPQSDLWQSTGSYKTYKILQVGSSGYNHDMTHDSSIPFHTPLGMSSARPSHQGSEKQTVLGSSQDFLAQIAAEKFRVTK